MTLALYGKSRKRQGGLLLAALLAIIGAAVGGLLLVGTAFAHHATITGSVKCEADGTYTITWTVANSQSDKYMWIDNSGADKVAVNKGSVSSVDGSRIAKSGSGQVVTTAPGSTTGDVYLTLYADWYSDKFQNNDHFRGGPFSNNGTNGDYGSPVSLTGDCVVQGKIQFHKYLPKSNPPENAPWNNQGNGQSSWTFNIYNNPDLAPGHLVASGNQLGSNITVPETDLWITEANSSGYSFFGFYVPDGDGTSGNDKCENQPLNGSTLGSSPLHITSTIWSTKGNHTGLLHICAYNKANGSVVVQKLTDTAQHPAADFTITVGSLTFSNVHLNKDAASSTIASSQSLPLGSDADVGESNIPTNWSQPTNTYYVKKYSQAGGGCSGSETYTSSATVPADGANYIVCVKNVYTATRTVTIAKVRTHTGASAGSAETFGGSITNGAVTSWSQSTPASDGTSSTNYSLDQQSHAIGEMLTAGQTTAGWKLIGFKKISGKNGSTGCGTTESGYTTNPSSITVPADASDYTICVLNKYDPAPPVTGNVIVKKIVSGEGSSNSDQFSGDLKKDGNTTSSITDLSAGTAHQFTNQPAGTYTFAETSHSGYDLVGYAKGSYSEGQATCPGAKSSSNPVGATLDADHTTVVLCVYNQKQAQVIGQGVTFVKIVCPSYGDVPRNQKANEGDATGGHWNELGAVAPSDADAAVDGTAPANCHTVSDWQFTISYDYWDFIYPFHHTGSRTVGTGPQSLSAAEVTAAKWGSLTVAEIVPGGGPKFGTLKCYKDHEKSDNSEEIDLPIFGDPVTGVYCVAYNVQEVVKPSITKTANAGATTSTKAVWTITIDNSDANSVDQTVIIKDANVTVVGASPATCTGDIADANGLSCTVAKGTTLTFDVQRTVTATCQGTSINNSATAELVGTHPVSLTGSPTGNVSATIPGDESLCKGTLVLKKIVDNTNGGNANSQSFTPKIDDNPTTWNDGHEVTPGSHTIKETGLDGYTPGSWTCDPENARTGNSQVNVPAGQTVTCTITNSSQKAHIIVEKDYVLNGGTKEAPTIDVNGSPIAGPNGTGGAAHDNWDQVDVKAGLVAVAENLPNSNWLQTGVEFSEGCNVEEDKLVIDVLGLFSVQNISVPGEQVYPGPGQTCTVTFTNKRQTGTVIVKKVVETASSVNPNDPNPAFTGLFDGSSWGNLQDGGTKTFTNVLAGSGHTITEADGTVNSPNDTKWHNDGFFLADREGNCPAGPAGESPLTPNNITVAANETTTICVLNRRDQPDTVTANVFVYKVIVGSFGSTTDTFTGTVTSPKGGGNFSITTLSGASFPLLMDTDHPNTTFSVAEAAKAGYTTLGYKVVEGNATCPAADGNYLSSVTNHAIGLSSSAAYTVCVYNDPRVTINVHKTEQNGAATINGNNWNITVSGCGITPKQAATDAQGNATFSNLPLCNSYVVSEDINSKGVGAFTPAFGFPTSVVVNATTAGNTYSVQFANIRFINPCAFNNCTPVIINTPTTPSATPTTPTATATPPTQKPTEPTKTEEPKTPEPTKTSVVLGEKTPGANATPLAPQTGSGLFGTGKSGSNLLLAVLGLFNLSAGLVVITMANKNKSRS